MGRHLTWWLNRPLLGQFLVSLLLDIGMFISSMSRIVFSVAIYLKLYICINLLVFEILGILVMFFFFHGRYMALNRTLVDTESKLGADGTPVSDPTLYMSLDGALMYLTFTRPDLSYAVQHEWLWKNKKDEDNTIISNKARLVAKGYRQEEGIEFKESFTPSKYALGILKKHGMEKCDSIGTTVAALSKLDADLSESDVDGSLWGIHLMPKYESEAFEAAPESPKHAPPSPSYTIDSLEYASPSDDNLELAKAQALPAPVSPTPLSPDYSVDSEPIEDDPQCDNRGLSRYLVISDIGSGVMDVGLIKGGENDV
ncbi:retrovirus-related pol polyprotein from transposon TNT 1-94 [Tanacetum coccineum]